MNRGRSRGRRVPLVGPSGGRVLFLLMWPS